MIKSAAERIIELAYEIDIDMEELAKILVNGHFITIEGSQIVPTPMGYLNGIFDSTGATSVMQIIEDTETHTTGIGYFQGNLMKFKKDKKTDEISMCAEGVAKALGFKDTHEMLSNDQVLDKLNQYKKATGEWPLKKN
ncbi:hypothetical protein PQ469_06010 [Mucilaginibacter sp. KACC 22773]|uniref:hypothetical protein n=1 Tax=Mucilaginibacter sp. KACC 22773 TaxID=3025671 RepID=UPI00236723B1|nr:hypothetical protein [Mucilaginibacter sp. KACC 22773]WDF79557.1 hypothetical protein PQ469_06010 [Mucilaginibacter sp. KACC 22773]